MMKSISITAEPIAGGKKGVPLDYRVANVFTVTPVVHVLGFSIPIGSSTQIILPRSDNEAIEKITTIKQNFENGGHKKSFEEAVPEMVEAQLINQEFHYYEAVQMDAMNIMSSFGKSFGFDSTVAVLRSTGKTYDDYMHDRAKQKKVAELNWAGLHL